jgi:hypothetical protein
MLGAVEGMMKAPSIGRMIGVAVGFCIAFWATFSLLSFIPLMPRIPGFMDRVGVFCTHICSAGALLFLWAAGSAYVIHKMSWSYRACRYVGWAFLVPGSLLFLSHGRLLSIANFLTVQIVLSGFICRRIAFPEISDEKAFAPAPLPTMFPK